MTLSENIAKIGRNRQNFNGSVRGVKSTVLGKLKAFSFIVRVVTVIAARKSGTLVVLPPLAIACQLTEEENAGEMARAGPSRDELHTEMDTGQNLAITHATSFVVR